MHLLHTAHMYVPDNRHRVVGVVKNGLCQLMLDVIRENGRRFVMFYLLSSFSGNTVRQLPNSQQYQLCKLS